MLIHEAVIQILQKRGNKGLTISEIFDVITSEKIHIDRNSDEPLTSTDVIHRVSGAGYKDKVFIKEDDLIYHKDIDDARLMRLTLRS